MSFSSVRTNVASRISEINLVFPRLQEAVTAASAPLPSTPSDVNTIKGLLFVYMYGVLEYAFETCVETAIENINQLSVRHCDFHPHSLPVSLLRHMKAFKDCGPGKYVPKMTNVFRKQIETEIAEIESAAFLDKVQNCSVENMDAVANAFGILDLQLEDGQRRRISEIVNNRLAVAHGRETPTFVGQRYDIARLVETTAVLSDAVNRIISAFEDHFSERRFIAEDRRPSYISPVVTG